MNALNENSRPNKASKVHLLQQQRYFHSSFIFPAFFPIKSEALHIFSPFPIEVLLHSKVTTLGRGHSKTGKAHCALEFVLLIFQFILKLRDLRH